MPKKYSRTKCMQEKSKITDIIVVEPSECDRWASNKLEDLVEGCWLFSRPPPVLYEREPAVTARRAEVARYWISGDGEEPVFVRPKLSTCAVKPKSACKFQQQRQSLPPKKSPRERLRSAERKSVL